MENFGVSIKRKLGNNLHFETGIYKITRATDQPFLISYYGQYPTGASIPFYYHHLSFPINFSYETRLFYFTGGPYAEFLVFETSDLVTDNNEMIVVIPYSINDRKFNFGINLNIGLEKSINKYLNFLVEGRASHNSLNTQKNPNSNNYKFKNYGLAVGVNYKFLN